MKTIIREQEHTTPLPAAQLPVIGLLGGAGPAAAAYIHQLLISEAQQAGAWQDEDYPEIIVVSAPLGLDEQGFQSPTAVQGPLRRSLQRLEAAGAQVILPACNTISALLWDTAVPVLHLPALAAAQATKVGAQRVGVLASSTSRRLGLFDAELRLAGVEPVAACDETQAQLDDLILLAMGGRFDLRETDRLLGLVDAMLDEQGADHVIIGCTELSLLLAGVDNPRVIDTAHLGARAANSYAPPTSTATNDEERR